MHIEVITIPVLLVQSCANLRLLINQAAMSLLEDIKAALEGKRQELERSRDKLTEVVHFIEDVTDRLNKLE